MGDMVRVEVFLSTFNGERYLKEQLGSILNQEGNFDLQLFIRDDGSTDQTCEILKEYESNQHVRVIYGSNIGINASIMNLISTTDLTSDFYAFADQDDVWFPNRMQKAIDDLQANPSDTPVLWTCNELLTDAELQVYGTLSTSKYLGDFRNAMIQNKVPGHTQVMNRAMISKLMKYPAEWMYLYDRVFYMTACALGEVIYHAEPCGFYRQHQHNEVGYDNNMLHHFWSRFRLFLKGRYINNANQLYYFHQYFKYDLKECDKNEIVYFLESRASLWKRLRYSITNNVKCDTIYEYTLFRLAYILGAFGKHSSV